MAAAQEPKARYEIPEGVHIELSKDFYEALKDNNSSGKKVYTTDRSIEYLKQIAISTKYMVETNLQILKHQETILETLNDLLDEKRK